MISRDQIIDAAVDLGVDQVTMAAVADRLGVTAPALYTHVQNRDELVTLVSERLVADIDAALVDDEGWEAFLRSLARAVRAAMSWSHWAVMAQVEGPSAAGVAIGERGFRVLVADGFTPEAAGRAMWLVLRVALTAGPASGPTIGDQIAAAPEFTDPPDDLPLTAAALERFREADMLDPFEADLDVIVAGLRAGRVS